MRRENIKYLTLRGYFSGYMPVDRRELHHALEYAQLDTARATQIYFWWVPRSFDLARRSGRRSRARNFRAFRRMCEPRA